MCTQVGNLGMSLLQKQLSGLGQAPPCAPRVRISAPDASMRAWQHPPTHSKLADSKMAASIIDLTEENSPAVDRPTPAPEHRLHRLQHALAVAQPERLRQTLLDLCSKCPDIAEKASALLLVAEDEAVSIHESDEESNRSDVEDGGTDSEASVTEPSSAIADEAPLVQASNGNKRLRPRYAVCINCDEEFDVTCNEKGDCTWHNGNALPMDFALTDGTLTPLQVNASQTTMRTSGPTMTKIVTVPLMMMG